MRGEKTSSSLLLCRFFLSGHFLTIWNWFSPWQLGLLLFTNHSSSLASLFMSTTYRLPHVLSSSWVSPGLLFFWRQRTHTQTMSDHGERGGIDCENIYCTLGDRDVKRTQERWTIEPHGDWNGLQDLAKQDSLLVDFGIQLAGFEAWFFHLIAMS